MTQIRVVDARMGRGKTSAAEAYMASESGRKRFLYITPYLAEVDRICDACDFEQPDSDRHTKLTELKTMMRQGRNIASTHSLFYLMDEDALSLVRERHYSIIIDEAIETVRRVPITSKDFEILVGVLANIDENGFLRWTDPEYTGKFDGYKDMADSGSLYVLDQSLLCIMRPDMLEAFDEVIMMTYLFGGQYQKAYLDYYGFDYTICGIDNSDGFRFTDEPDDPPPLDYKSLISVVSEDRLNAIGDYKFALSKSWYDRRGMSHEDIRRIRNNLNTFFRRRCNCGRDRQLWTCFKSDQHKIEGDKGKYHESYLQPTAKATNEYRSRDSVAYLINRFIDPNVSKFFDMRGVKINEDEFALGEMLQFLWRSAIRDNKPVTLYIPSKRMRTLLLDWIDKNSEGGDAREPLL